MDTSDLVRRLKGLRFYFAKLGVACCTCGVKTFQPEYHDAACKVRVVAEALDSLDEIDTALAEQAEKILKLEDLCAAYKGQVEYGAAEIERLKEALYAIANIGAKRGMFAATTYLLKAEDTARAALKQEAKT